ncbi:MAG: peptidoglycan DD-metalloendopeptidase family protein [Chloroflexota bacterium]
MNSIHQFSKTFQQLIQRLDTALDPFETARQDALTQLQPYLSRFQSKNARNAQSLPLGSSNNLDTVSSSIVSQPDANTDVTSELAYHHTSQLHFTAPNDQPIRVATPDNQTQYQQPTISATTVGSRFASPPGQPARHPQPQNPQPQNPQPQNPQPQNPQPQNLQPQNPQPAQQTYTSPAQSYQVGLYFESPRKRFWVRLQTQVHALMHVKNWVPALRGLSQRTAQGISIAFSQGVSTNWGRRLIKVAVVLLLILFIRWSLLLPQRINSIAALTIDDLESTRIAVMGEKLAVVNPRNASLEKDLAVLAQPLLNQDGDENAQVILESELILVPTVRATPDASESVEENNKEQAQTVAQAQGDSQPVGLIEPDVSVNSLAQSNDETVDEGTILLPGVGEVEIGDLFAALDTDSGPLVADTIQETEGEQIQVANIQAGVANGAPINGGFGSSLANNLPRLQFVPFDGVRLGSTPTPPLPTPTPTPTLPPRPIERGSLWSAFQPRPAVENDHFWIERPFGPSAGIQLASPSYQFGSTAGNRYRPHHGIDISNPLGTPILAGTTGEVIHAGMDDPQLLGPYNRFYGNTVVIRLDRRLPVAGGEVDVLVLYGHLSEVYAQVGQRVEPGDVVGTVGMTGIAIGPHLHVEVRIGGNTYQDSVNPYLWLRPLNDSGAVAVRLLTAEGRTWSGARVSIARFVGGRAVWGRQIETYLDNENLSPDPAWGENGAMGSVPPGQYYLIGNVNGERFAAEFVVNPGQTTFVEIRTQQ